jgi:hypothetical protein
LSRTGRFDTLSARVRRKRTAAIAPAFDQYSVPP